MSHCLHSGAMQFSHSMHIELRDQGVLGSHCRRTVFFFAVWLSESPQPLVVEARKLFFSIVACDGIDKIPEGTHQRFIIDAAKFDANLAAKINAE